MTESDHPNPSPQAGDLILHDAAATCKNSWENYPTIALRKLRPRGHQRGEFRIS